MGYETFVGSLPSGLREAEKRGKMDYYNEFDEYPLQWLRNLQAAGHIPNGTFDGRSIVDVKAEDLEGVRSAHFFAGIGGWPLALKLAGWPEDQEVWTGSCPCQPFSVAGARKGKKDKRHLWPEFFRLIGKRRPAVVFGEQVASADGRAWFAGVRADLESLGYAVGGADLCAAGAGEEGEGWILRGDQIHEEPVLIGAPHIRQRLFWVAHTTGWKPKNGGLQRGWQHRLGTEDGGPGERARRPVGSEEVETGRMAEPQGVRYGADGLESEPGRRECATRQDDVSMAGRVADVQADGRIEERQDGQGRDERSDQKGRPARSGLRGASGGMADSHKTGREFCGQRDDKDRDHASGGNVDGRRQDGRVAGGERAGLERLQEQSAREEQSASERGGIPCGVAKPDGGERGQGDLPKQAGPYASNPWSSFDVLDCADGKARRVESGTFPLVNGVPARVGKLRAYGNAIVPEEAAEFIKAFLECFKT